jgi:hypothetical protein
MIIFLVGTSFYICFAHIDQTRWAEEVFGFTWGDNAVLSYVQVMNCLWSHQVHNIREVEEDVAWIFMGTSGELLWMQY